MPVEHSRVLLLYSTVDGQTQKICERLATRFSACGKDVTVSEMGREVASDMAPYDLVIIGASIRYGFHRRNVRDFMRQNRDFLQERKCAFFSVNLVARKLSRAQADTNPYVQHFLRSIGWQPFCVEVFAGRLDYPRCNPLDRFMIRLIMRMTGGPTDPRTVVEYTDWSRVDEWGGYLLGMLMVPEKYIPRI